MFYFLVSLTLASAVYSAVYIDAPCPDAKPVSNFNLSAMSNDTWYEIGRYPNDYENRADCGSITFNIRDSGVTFQIMDVANQNRNILNGIVDYEPGVGTAGILNFNSSGFAAPEGTRVLHVFVLDVVYDKYFIAYECKYDETKKRRHDYAWVLSKTTKLDEDSQKAVDAFLKSKNFINRSIFIWDHFQADACKVKA